MRKMFTLRVLLSIVLIVSIAIVMSCAAGGEKAMKQEQYEKQKSAEVGFVEFDVPPQPAEGMMAIMKNIVYPEDEVASGTEGKSLIVVVIDKSGKVNSVEVAKSSGSTTLDKAAVEAVKVTEWNAAMLADEPVTAKVVVPIMFKLQEKEGEPGEGNTKGKQ